MSRPSLPVVRLESVAVTYRCGTCALQRTDLDIRAGSFVVLLGASGAGKSTLLRTLNGLVRPTSGRVVIPEIRNDLGDALVLHAHRRRTGMVFQQHHLIGRLNVLDNVLTGRLGWRDGPGVLLPWSRAEKAMALAAIERVGLLDKALVRADALSGGQQQRVGIARALVQQPRLLLADEPVASLDPASAERVLSLLHGICRRDGVAIVVSLHQVALARAFADRIVGLSAGRVVFDGPPAALDDGRAALLYHAPVPDVHAVEDRWSMQPRIAQEIAS